MKVAISDIHGHYVELMNLYHTLVNKHDLRPERDQIIFLGDYVDGGYRTSDVINQLMEWQERYPHWRFLYGNHEDLLLQAQGTQHFSNVFELWWKQGGRATAFSYIPEEEFTKYDSRHATSFIPKEHIEWMKSLPRYYEDQDYIFVHAGINPTIWKRNPGMENQQEFDLMWIRDPFIQSTRDFGKKVIFGHTANAEPIVKENKIGIDTMFHNQGKLTAVILPSEEFVFSPSVTEKRPYWDRDPLEAMSGLWF